MPKADPRSLRRARTTPKGICLGLYISAFGIHTGGGLVLLIALLARAGAVIAHASLDSRLQGVDAVSGTWGISYVRRSLLARVCDSFRSGDKVGPGGTLLCLNGLPPLRPVRGRVLTYVQASYLVGLHKGIRYRPLTALRIVVERAWFKLGARNSDEFWVQTESMRAALKRQNPKAIVRIVPFVDDLLYSGLDALPTTQNPNVRDYSKYSFFYPADSVGHKNHTVLLIAWRLLAEQGSSPRLILTLDEAELGRLLAEAGMERLPNVEACGNLARAAVLETLSRSSALVFPSLSESFGLPLLEARTAGTPIIASERDFVRDVCVPEQTFDPSSPRSIARAVRRFVDGTVDLESCYSAAQFVELLQQ